MSFYHRIARISIGQSRNFTDSSTPSWSRSTIGGGFTKDGLLQWAMLTDFGSDTNMNGQQMRRRRRQMNDDPSRLPYVDLFSQSISKECCNYLTHQPSVSGLLGKAFFGSRQFLPEKYLLTALNSAFSLYPHTAISLPEFELNDRFLQWKVTMNAPLELICSWGIERYDIKGCTMMAFDPSVRKVYHGNCINVRMQTLEGLEFRHVTRLHVMYANFLLGGMVDELESRYNSKTGI
jgi:hypothetical protein